jgi:hypothetical protein
MSDSFKPEMTASIVESIHRRMCRAWAREFAPKLEAIVQRTPYEQEMILADEMDKVLKMYAITLSSWRRMPKNSPAMCLPTASTQYSRGPILALAGSK